MGVFIIAEAGVNHNGSIELAKKLVDVAVVAGADAVKFQCFRAQLLATEYAPKAEYQKKNCRSRNQFEMLKKLELDWQSFSEIKHYCDEKGILFLCSPFDVESANFLYSLGVEIFKIASGEITDYPLLRQIASFGRPVILSTGMAEIHEIEGALEVLVKFGLKRDQITLLHCTSCYPADYDEINLRAMLTMASKFRVKIGYSDHSRGIEVSIAAVALGAEVIEKHFTLDKDMEGPDHRASLDPKEFANLVNSIRNIEKALGSYEKKPSAAEYKNRLVARKSIVASRFIKKGEVFCEDNLMTLRPGTGLNPMLWPNIIGKVAPKDFRPGELIEL